MKYATRPMMTVKDGSLSVSMTIHSLLCPYQSSLDRLPEAVSRSRASLSEAYRLWSLSVAGFVQLTLLQLTAPVLYQRKLLGGRRARFSKNRTRNVTTKEIAKGRCISVVVGIDCETTVVDVVPLISGFASLGDSQKICVYRGCLMLEVVLLCPVWCFPGLGVIGKVVAVC